MHYKTKGKAKQAKGATSTAHALNKSTQTARVQVLTEDEEGSLTDDEVSFPTQGNMHGSADEVDDGTACRPVSLGQGL